MPITLGDQNITSSTGNLGIGVGAPNATLHILTEGTSTTSVIRLEARDSGSNSVRFLTTQNSDGSVNLRSNAGGNGSSSDFIFSRGAQNVEVMRVEGGGAIRHGSRIFSNDVETRSATYSIAADVRRRVRVTLATYNTVRVQLHARRTNGGGAYVFWEGYIANHNNESFSTATATRPSGSTIVYTFSTPSPGVFQWDFNAAGSSANGNIIIEGGGVGMGGIDILTY